MDLFTYLMAKNGNNTSVHGDLFSYLLGKGQSQTQTISGTTIYIPDAKKLVSFMMTKESTQDGEPTPDNPVEVKTVKGSVDVKVVGKNLWSLENQYSFTSREATWYFINGIRGAYGSNIGNKTQKKFFCESGKTYIFQMTFDNSVSSSSMVWSDESGGGITRISPTSSSGQVEFKIIGRDDYVIPRIYMNANSSISITNVMIEEVSSSATSASEYEAYKETTTTIPLNNNEIVGIGDYKDELLVDKTGHVYLNKKTGKQVFNGTESWTIEHLTGVPNNFYRNVSNALGGSNKPILNNIGRYTDALKNFNYATYISSGKNINFRCDENNSVTNFQTMLSNQNMIIYYPIATPELIDLQTTVDLSLFKGVNNVSNSEDGYMTIEYR